MTGLRKFLWPLGFSTRYTTHPYEPVDTEKIESLLKSDRPLFVGIERSVPSSAFSRVANFAWLGGSLITGSIAQGFRTGFSESWKSLW